MLDRSSRTKHSVLRPGRQRRGRPDACSGIRDLGSAITVTPTWMPDNGRGSTVSVRARFTYSSLIPIVPLPPVTVEAESRLVVNN